MYLSTNQIVALQNLKGIGSATIIKVGNYLHDNNISIDGNDLYAFKEILDCYPKNIFKKYSDDDVNYAFEKANEIVLESKSKGIGIIGYWDDLFPQMLKDVIDEEGKQKPCPLLFYKGNLNATQKLGIAIIGTREPDNDGIRAGRFFASEFAKQGVNIISGLAVGCDTIGHRCALEIGTPTTAFLAHGLDIVYPPENKELADEIVSKGGLLLSEYAISTQVSRYNLVNRDRLQSALANACVVIETGVHGGTMHAARTTLKSKKTLLAVEYKNINSECKSGNLQLVENGAKPITSSFDIKAFVEKLSKQQMSNTNLPKNLFA